MTALRVLIPLHNLDAGGVERIALRLAHAWRGMGVEIRLVLGRDDGILAAQGAALAPDILAPRWLATRRWETLWMIVALPRLMRRHRPDVIFCAGNTYAIVAVAMKLLFGTACPPIVAKISNDLERRDLPAPVRWCYHRWLRVQTRFIDAFVGIAEPMREEIVGRFAVAPARVSVIDDPAVDDASLAAFAAAPRVRRHPGRQFLSVGRLAPQKAVHNAIEAFARIARPDDRLVILGEGEERAKLERLVASRGVDGQVSLPGHVGDLPGWFASSDAYVLSSDYEGVPAVVIEALAAGIPIVATNCCASMATLIDGVGRLVPVGDIGALAAAMDGIADDPVHTAAMRARASQFTVETAAPAWLRLFERCVVRQAGEVAVETPPGPANAQRHHDVTL